VAADLEVEALGVLFDQDLEQAALKRQDVTLCLAEAQQADVVPGAVQVDPQALRRLLDLGLDLAVAEPQKVFRQEPPP
jgi:hypothetical protein